MATSPPIIPALPPAPNRNDAPADFSTKADTFVAALPPMVTKENELAAWQNELAAEMGESATAAAASALAAAQSVVDATHQVELATAQVGLATTQAGNSATSASQAQAYAQAAGAGIAPPPVANTFLGADSLGIVGWRGIPQSFVTGDILDSARPLTAPTWLPTDGSIYLQSGYPALYAAIGPALTPFNPALKIPDPSTLPTNNGSCSAWSADSVYLAVGLALTLYKRSGNVLTKLAPVDVAPTGPVNGLAFSSDGIYLVAAHGVSPFVSIYKRTGDSFAKLPDPLTLPGGGAQSASFTLDGQYLAIGSQTGPGVLVYKRSGDSFTALAFPATAPATCYNVSFSDDGTYLFATGTATPFVFFYKRTADSFTKLADPADLPTAQILPAAAMTRDGVYALAAQNTGLSHFYKRTGDVYSRLSTLPPWGSVPTGIAWSQDGTTLAVGITASPYVQLFRRTGDTLTSISAPDVLPAGAAGRPSFSADNKFLAIPHTTTPFLSVYKAAPFDLASEFKVPTLTQPGTFANIKRYIKA